MPQAHLSVLNKLFFGYSILSESVFGPVLPWQMNRPGASGQPQTWPARPSNRVLHDALAFAEIGHLFLGLLCTKDVPPDRFSIISHMVAYRSNSQKN